VSEEQSENVRLRSLVDEQARIIDDLEAALGQRRVVPMKKRHGIPLASLVGKRVRIWLDRASNQYAEGVVRASTRDCNGTPWGDGRVVYSFYDDRDQPRGHWRPSWIVTETRDLEVIR